MRAAAAQTAAVVVCLGAALGVAACARAPTVDAATAQVPAAAAAAATDFRYEYLAPEAPQLAAIHARVTELDLLRALPEIEWLDGLLALPAPITYATEQCGEPTALYWPERNRVVLCYELLRALYQQGLQWAAANGQAGAAADDAARRYVLANTRFILSHETGHALIELLDLPVTGLQEDAVDQFATVLMQGIAGADESPAQVYQNLRMAANWFLARGAADEFSLAAYADAHSLGLQRYFNLQCLVYGSDPQRFANLIADGDLTAARARTCPAESRRARDAWLRLLLPHLAQPMTLEQARERLQQRQRGRPQDAE